MAIYMWLAVVCCMAVAVRGGGFITEPPSAGTLHLYDSSHPAVDNNYMNLNCGGPTGTCGMCGDADDGTDPLPHEGGGVFSRGYVTRNATSFSTFDVTVTLTTPFSGYMQFILYNHSDSCSPVDTATAASQLLSTNDGVNTFTSAVLGANTYSLALPGWSCTACVLRWEWQTSPAWQGPHERYFGCANLAIDEPATNSTCAPVPPTPTTTIPVGCAWKAAGAWFNNADMDNWCYMHCPNINCPASHCACV